SYFISTTYFLSNNKYLKSLKDKSLFLRDLIKFKIQRIITFFSIMTIQVLCMVGEKDGLCFNGLNTPKFKITYEKLCINFSNIFTPPKKFYRHFKKKFSEKLKISFIFKEKFMKNFVPNFQNLVIKEKIFTIFQPQNYLQIFAILTYFQNKKFDFDENCFCVKNPYQLDSISFGAEVKNRSIFTAPNVVERHKKKKNTHLLLILPLEELGIVGQDSREVGKQKKDWYLIYTNSLFKLILIQKAVDSEQSIAIGIVVLIGKVVLKKALKSLQAIKFALSQDLSEVTKLFIIKRDPPKI
ncbi:hypothetical protein AGLY_011475, partial [Aphis glycines]